MTEIKRTNELKPSTIDNSFCECGGYIDTDYEWYGENEDGYGQTRCIERCEECGDWTDYMSIGG